MIFPKITKIKVESCTMQINLQLFLLYVLKCINKNDFAF